MRTVRDKSGGIRFVPTKEDIINKKETDKTNLINKINLLENKINLLENRIVMLETRN